MSEDFIEEEHETSKELMCLGDNADHFTHDTVQSIAVGDIERVERFLLRGLSRASIAKKMGKSERHIDKCIAAIRRTWVKNNFTDLLELRGEVMAQHRMMIQEVWKQWAITKDIGHLKFLKELVGSIVNLFDLDALNKPEMLQFASLLKQTSADVERAVEMANKLDAAKEKMTENATTEQSAGSSGGIATASRAELVALLNAAQRVRSGGA